jgi:hypothetical protein
LPISILLKTINREVLTTVTLLDPNPAKAFIAKREMCGSFGSALNPTFPRETKGENAHRRALSFTDHNSELARKQSMPHAGGQLETTSAEMEAVVFVCRPWERIDYG